MLAEKNRSILFRFQGWLRQGNNLSIVSFMLIRISAAISSSFFCCCQKLEDSVASKNCNDLFGFLYDSIAMIAQAFPTGHSVFLCWNSGYVLIFHTILLFSISVQTWLLGLVCWTHQLHSVRPLLNFCYS